MPPPPKCRETNTHKKEEGGRRITKGKGRTGAPGQGGREVLEPPPKTTRGKTLGLGWGPGGGKRNQNLGLSRVTGKP